MPKLFGREPAVWVGVIEATLTLAVVFGLGLTNENAALIVAAVAAGFGAVTAFYTRDAMLGYVVGFAKATVAVAVGFGLELTTEQTGAVLAVVAVLVGFFQRTQTSPLGYADH